MQIVTISKDTEAKWKEISQQFMKGNNFLAFWYA